MFQFEKMSWDTNNWKSIQAAQSTVGDVSPKELGTTELFSTPDTISSSLVGLK